MAARADAGRLNGVGNMRGRLARLAGSPAFQRWAARTPIIRRLARREGDAIFDLLAGFCKTQILTALVDCAILDRLADGPKTQDALAAASGVHPDRLLVLLRGGIAIGVLRKRRDTVALTSRGAALVGVPGLTGMIRHNAILYRDLADPAAFFRGDTTPEMAAFWPYVFGAAAADDPDSATRYSKVMSDSQTLVAEDLLAAVDFSGVRHLLDVGGGTGTFLDALGSAHPQIERSLLDLPAVIDVAAERFSENEVTLHAGSFRDAALPTGADAISLVRILFDHGDDTVRALLGRVHAALPPGGLLIIAEPMGVEDRPATAADAYYALYTLAMGTGRTRTVEEVSQLCREAGFVQLKAPHANRPFMTRIVTAMRADV